MCFHECVFWWFFLAEEELAAVGDDDGVCGTVGGVDGEGFEFLDNVHAGDDVAEEGVFWG